MAIGISNIETAKKKYVKAKEAYYNGQPVMTDAMFDSLEDEIKRIDPKWKELKKTGVKVANKKTEVPLEEFMPSLNKMYPEDVTKFYKRSSSRKVVYWIDMDKLDGTSLQLIYHHGEPVRLITRGDGTNGGDISFFIPWLVKLGRIPERISARNRVVFRVEGVMQKRVFQKYWSSKYDNARNLVNGIFNKKEQHEALKHVDMVVLGVYGRALSSGLQDAMEWGHQVVDHIVTELEFNAEDHKEFLEIRRKVSLYEIDGTVRGPSNWVMKYASADKPKEVIAFKLNDEESAAEVEALEEIWEKTRLNRWSCKIRIKPTVMDGVTVTYVTAHNPGWMKDMGVGRGAILKVLRSGGVIPKIVGVVKKAKFKGPPGEYELRGRFFYAAEEDKATRVQKIHHFLTTLGIEFLAEKTIEKLYDVGYIGLYNYIELGSCKTLDWGKSGIKNAKLGDNLKIKILEELHRVLSRQINLKKLMVASGCFENGIGERKLKLLEDAGISMSDLLLGKWNSQAILAIKGFSDKTTRALIEGLIFFKKWFEPYRKTLSVDGSLPTVKKAKAGKLAGVTVVWTGYRDKKEEALVEMDGGEVASSFSSKTTVLLYKEGGKASTKVAKAGDRAMTWEQFQKRYKL